MSHEFDPYVVIFPETDIILPSYQYKFFHSGFTLYYGNGSEHFRISCSKKFRDDRSVESFSENRLRVPNPNSSFSEK